MAITDKQARNGVPGPDGSRGTQPGPDVTGAVASLQGQSEAAADVRVSEAATFLGSPQGAGPAPTSAPGSAGRQLGAAGNMWDWDSGLAVSEMPGEASDVG